MQTAKIEINKQIQIAVKTGKVSFGINEAIDAARFAKAKLVILASNCPLAYKESIERYAKQSTIPIFNYEGNSIDLGAACTKPFIVAALTIREPGDSEILKLAER
jgi:large subunit ribosomal protein L30e